MHTQHTINLYIYETRTDEGIVAVHRQVRPHLLLKEHRLWVDDAAATHPKVIPHDDPATHQPAILELDDLGWRYGWHGERWGGRR